jgi:hypothetical protein
LIPAGLFIENPFDPKRFSISCEGMALIHLQGLGDIGGALGFDEEVLELGREVAHQIVDGRWRPNQELDRLAAAWMEAFKKANSFDEAAAIFLGVTNPREFFARIWKDPKAVSPELMRQYMLMHAIILCFNPFADGSDRGYVEDFQQSYERHFGRLAS